MASADRMAIAMFWITRPDFRPVLCQVGNQISVMPPSGSLLSILDVVEDGDLDEAAGHHLDPQRPVRSDEPCPRGNTNPIRS